MYSLRPTGSALIISLVVMTLLTMMTTVFFEKVFNFSKRSNGIENSNVAYYKALGSIEESLYTGTVNKYTPWNIQNFSGGSFALSGTTLTASTGGNTIPVSGKGNSPYDLAKNYNIISLGEPVQIVIPEGVTWSNVFFEFRVPTILNNTNTGVAAASIGSGYILWTLASSGMSLFASGEINIFRGVDINVLNVRIDNLRGTTSSGSESSFSDFYNLVSYLGTNGAKCGANYQCTLKLSMIRPVPTTDSRSMSFLEYRITGLNRVVPSQYMNIRADGYAYGFLRTREIQFPQITTNTALDFAVLQ